MSRVVVVGGASVVPVVWNFLGFHIQAGPAIVGVCGVIIMRLALSLNTTGPRRLALDLVVMVFCAFLTLLMVQAQTMSLFVAGMTGMGIASLGLGAVEIIKSRVSGRLKAALDALLGAAPPPPSPPDPEADLIQKLDDVKGRGE